MNTNLVKFSSFLRILPKYSSLLLMLVLFPSQQLIADERAKKGKCYISTGYVENKSLVEAAAKKLFINFNDFELFERKDKKIYLTIGKTEKKLFDKLKSDGKTFDFNCTQGKGFQKRYSFDENFKLIEGRKKFIDFQSDYFAVIAPIEAEKKRLVDAEVQRQVEARMEAMRLAEIKKQEQAAAEKERLRLAEIARQEKAEAYRLAAIEKQRQAEAAAEKQRLAAIEKQRQAEAAVLEKARLAQQQIRYIEDNFVRGLCIFPLDAKSKITHCSKDHFYNEYPFPMATFSLFDNSTTTDMTFNTAVMKERCPVCKLDNFYNETPITYEKKSSNVVDMIANPGMKGCIITRRYTMINDRLYSKTTPLTGSGCTDYQLKLNKTMIDVQAKPNGSEKAYIRYPVGANLSVRWKRPAPVS